MTAAWWALGIGWPFVTLAVAVLISKRLSRPASDLEAMVDATREPPPLGDEHAERLLRLVREDGETR